MCHTAYLKFIWWLLAEDILINHLYVYIRMKNSSHQRAKLVSRLKNSQKSIRALWPKALTLRDKMFHWNKCSWNLRLPKKRKMLNPLKVNSNRCICLKTTLKICKIDQNLLHQLGFKPPTFQFQAKLKVQSSVTEL